MTLEVVEEATQIALPVTKRWEGLFKIVRRQPRIEVAPYICPAGFWTIGWGHLCPKEHPDIDEAAAEAYLVVDLGDAFRATLKQCPVLATQSPHKLAAIADFTFNLGPGRLQMSTLRRRVNQLAWDEVVRELRRWVYGGGRALPGLVARREAEIELILK